MTHDVSIIGGSTAGFYTAFLLAKKGVRVRLFEENDQIGQSSRTLIVTRHLESILGPICHTAVMNRIFRFELFADGRVAEVRFKSPDLVIDRSRLIRNLAEMAESAGAKILAGARFNDFHIHRGNIHFSINRHGNGALENESTRVLVGADGTFSRVAKKAGWPGQATVALAQAVVDLPEDMSADTTRIWFLPGVTPFFFWLIPHSPSQGVLGLIGQEEGHTRKSLERFMSKKGIKSTGFQAAPIPLYTRWFKNHRRFGKSHVYLVGDAAGHVKATTVGGMVTGLRGALGAAEAILNGGTSKKINRLRRELDRHKWIRRILQKYDKNDYVRLFDLLTPSTKRSLGSITRDEPGRLIWHAIFRQPQLFPLGLKTLFVRR